LIKFLLSKRMNSTSNTTKPNSCKILPRSCSHSSTTDPMYPMC
jgi:hypothetical protein